jgi:hypothetical protein
MLLLLDVCPCCSMIVHGCDVCGASNLCSQKGSLFLVGFPQRVGWQKAIIFGEPCILACE